MSYTEKKIDTQEAALDYLREALNGKLDDKIIKMDVSSWASLQVNVKGDRYSSTLTTSMMKALAELQVDLNRTYAKFVYGKGAQSLTDEERASLELTFKVESGSTGVTVAIEKAINLLNEKVLDKMTGGQIVVSVLGVAIIFGGVSALNTVTDSRLATQKEDNRQEITRLAVESQPKLAELQLEMAETLTSFIRSAQDADQITIGGQVLSKEQIEDISKTERVKTEIERMDGSYRVVSLKRKTESYRIEISKDGSDSIIGSELYGSSLSPEEFLQIATAFAQDKPIMLNVIAKTRDGVISSANIVGVKNQAKGESVDEKSLVARRPDM